MAKIFYTERDIDDLHARGVTSIDGAAGGGLTPWAVIGSNATEGQWGATATASVVSTS